MAYSSIHHSLVCLQPAHFLKVLKLSTLQFSDSEDVDWMNEVSTFLLLVKFNFKSFYQLDAAHMLTSPGLAWQEALKMTDVKLDLFTDIGMHLFIEKGIRGGVSMISHRHSEAKHPQCPNYDASEANKYITYLEDNNLYG
ncbi:hypothetical protein AVEN_73964-1 [Araneus ventricosus]|uniref:Uncharacterized protein n=1 Tax=Araneus ventricosus TaxID=182803 RepID=A0A4Y2L0Y1_ARAVE|nr:hypothetical protein AVEN_73964-1 [Araneus ventricosus]